MKAVDEELIQDRIRYLWENTDFLSTLFESLVGYAIIAADFDGNIIAYNEGARYIYGYAPEEVIGKRNIETFFPAEFIEAGNLQQVIDALMREGSFGYEGEKVRKNGERFPAQFHFALTRDNKGEMIGFVEIVEDLTERKRAEEDLRKHREHLEELVGERTAELQQEIAERKRAEEELKQSQAQLIGAEKMSAVGVLAAGVAHELNNPMMGLINFIQYCLKHTAEDDRRYAVLQDAEREAERCIKIVRNLLTFSRIDKEGAEAFEKAGLAVILERVAALLSYRIGKERVSLTSYVAEDTPETWIKPNNIQQTLLNIVINALDAVKESEKKEVHIDVHREGEFVQMTIADSGCGIAPENLQKIFNPFFTTKPAGEGIGLGLSICREIIQEHGGEIECESEPGAGTTFKITLPIERREERGGTK